MTLFKSMTHSVCATVVCALLLTACDDQGAKEAAAADAALRPILASGKISTDPWQTYQKMSSAEQTILAANNPCHTDFGGVESCVPVPVKAEFDGQRAKLLTDAVSRSDKNAIAKLYEQTERPDDEYAALRKASVDKLVLLADSAGDLPIDRTLLIAAGRTFAEGRLVIMDTHRAVGYYARAWALGSDQSAASISFLFHGIHDERNAYLWALRCIDDCSPEFSYLSATSLQENLSPAAATQAQQAAADRSVVELDTKGG